MKYPHIEEPAKETERRIETHGKIRYRCAHCTPLFLLAEISDLKIHINGRPNGERPPPCPIRRRDEPMING